MVFLDFRPITRGRLRRSRVVFWILVLAALSLYGATAVSCAFPGASASWIAWAAGLDVREAPSHPLLMALGRWVSGLPSWEGALALRLNLLAAVAGALTVGWVYKVVWFFVFELMREESAVMHASRNARFGGLVAAAAVGLSLPVWQAATRFQPEIFDLALLAACAQVLAVYARSQSAAWLLLFGALFGAGLAESSLFIVASPIMAAFAVIVEWKLAWCGIGRLFAAIWLSAAAFVGTHVWSARAYALDHGWAVSAETVLRIAVSVLREQADDIGRMFPERLWLPVFVLGLGAAALSFFVAFRSLDNRRSWSTFILSAVLTVFAFFVLFNVPFSPWGVVAVKGVIPAATYLFAGVGIGLLAASWRALAVLDDPVDVGISADGEDESDDEADSLTEQPRMLFHASRGGGVLALPVLVAAVAVGGAINSRWLFADEGAFADRAADELLDGLEGRRWVVANGIIDANVLIRAHGRGSRVHLLCPFRAREKSYVAAVLEAVKADSDFSENVRLRAESLIGYSFHLFIDDLFAADEAIGGKAVVMGLPDLWYGAGWVPVPERLFYGGARRAETLKTRDLMSEHAAFWTRWEGFLAEGEGRPRQLSYRYRVAWRRHLAFVANNLGVALDDGGRPEQAFDAYLKARAFYPDSLSALLNVFDLVARGSHPEMKEAVEWQLREKVERGKDRYPLWALSRYYGYVRNYELFVRMGWTWALSSSPGAILAGLRNTYSLQADEEKRMALSAMMASIYEMRGDYAQSATEYTKTLVRDPQNTFAISGLARLALQRNVADEARKVLETGEAAGAPKRQLRQDWAAFHLMTGDLPRARILLQEICEESDPAPMVLAMLAMVMIEQRDMGAVEAKVLPRLVKDAKGQNAYFAQVIQGRVWQSKGDPGYENARLCFQRAALIRPDVQALADVLLSMDVALKDQKSAEAHALAILRQRADHPYANFIMGSIRLEQGQYGDAETYLRRSAASDAPLLAALNNYAEVLCRIRKLDEAEKAARQAVAQAPERYEGWSTLAFVLAEKGAPDPASEALAKARAIDGRDERLCLIDALIAVKRNAPERADEALARMGGASELSLADRRLMAELREETARLRRER
jgi:tetratricopeptide (TPR) repeat protein